VKILALVQPGAMLKAMEKNTGTKGIGNSLVPKENRTPILSELGFEKKSSIVAK